MVELNGKYNSCKVFTDNVDNETISQLITLLNQEFIKDSNIRIMPDTHAGSGCVIGTTLTIKDKIVPNLVGVDIGCGMLSLKLRENKIDFKKLDDIIHKKVPSGFKIHDKAVAHSNADKILAPVDVDKAFKSLGTLGGGNHFIEVDRDNRDNLWLVIHTGSRHLGIEVCKYYQELAWKNLSSKKDRASQLIQQLKQEGREKEIEQAIKNMSTGKCTIPKDLCYVEGDDMKHYLHDMHFAQEHAKINRQTIAGIITKEMDLHIEEQMDTIHNYIDLDNMILRKGSVSAELGEKLIIPMNMRDGSLICVGKGNPDWNYSAPHGAGRLMSRSKAKDNVLLDEFKESMKDIYTSCVGLSTIDEAPQVYKPMEEIMQNIKDTVDIVDIIKPVYNYKACEQQIEKEKEEPENDREEDLDR